MTQQAPKGKRVKHTQLYRGDDAPEQVTSIPVEARSKEDFKAEISRRREYRESSKLLERMAEAGV